MNYRIFPPTRLPEAEITLPLSKSVSNRALIIAALTPGMQLPENVAHCGDTRVLRSSLESQANSINVGACGTAMRFLTAFYACSPGKEVILDGDSRMRQRPIKALVDALRVQGASITYMENEGFPPLKISGRRLAGGEITVDATVSSQFISALLMVAPLGENPLTLRLSGEVRSFSYIKMTLAMMERAGVECDLTMPEIRVPVGTYSPVEQNVEHDWSAAAFWYEVCALTSGFISLPGLADDSLQGDRACADIFAHLGITTEFTAGGAEIAASPDIDGRLYADLSDNPDLAPAIAVTCALTGTPFHLSGLESLRIKECDRIAAVTAELAKLGIMVHPSDSGMEWERQIKKVENVPAFDVYADHRLAMALAPVAACVPGIVINDADAVNKSYPEFWDDLRRCGYVTVDASLSPEEIQAHLEAEGYFDEPEDDGDDFDDDDI